MKHLSMVRFFAVVALITGLGSSGFAALPASQSGQVAMKYAPFITAELVSAQDDTPRRPISIKFRTMPTFKNLTEMRPTYLIVKAFWGYQEPRLFAPTVKILHCCDENGKSRSFPLVLDLATMTVYDGSQGLANIEKNPLGSVIYENGHYFVELKGLLYINEDRNEVVIQN